MTDMTGCFIVKGMIAAATSSLNKMLVEYNPPPTHIRSDTMSADINTRTLQAKDRVQEDLRKMLFAARELFNAVENATHQALTSTTETIEDHTTEIRAGVERIQRSYINYNRDYAALCTYIECGIIARSK